MGGKIKRRPVEPDPTYNSIIVGQTINYVLKKGKKTLARNIVYKSFEIINQKTNRPAIDVFEEAVRNARPMLEVKPRRVGGAVYQIPREVPEKRGVALALRWIVEAAKKKKGKPMHEKMAIEIMACANKEGEAIRKRDAVHKMAEANKAFAHLG